jgi:hypothetical protein
VCTCTLCSTLAASQQIPNLGNGCCQLRPRLALVASNGTHLGARSALMPGVLSLQTGHSCGNIMILNKVPPVRIDCVWCIVGNWDVESLGLGVAGIATDFPVHSPHSAAAAGPGCGAASERVPVIPHMALVPEPIGAVPWLQGTILTTVLRCPSRPYAITRVYPLGKYPPLFLFFFNFERAHTGDRFELTWELGWSCARICIKYDATSLKCAMLRSCSCT